MDSIHAYVQMKKKFLYKVRCVKFVEEIEGLRVNTLYKERTKTKFAEEKEGLRVKHAREFE